MKKTLLFLFTLFSFIARAYQIDISIKGVKEDYCKLAFYYSEKQLLHDSTFLDKKGEGSFSGDGLLDRGIYLIVLPNGKYFELLINKDQEFEITTDTVDIVKNMSLKNADPDTDKFLQYVQFLAKKSIEVSNIKSSKKDLTNKEQVKVNLIEKEIRAYKNNLTSVTSESFAKDIILSTTEITVPEKLTSKQEKWHYYNRHYLDNINFANEGMLRTPIFHKKLMHFMDKVNYQIPDSIINATDFIINKAKKNDQVYQYVVSQLTNKYANSKVMGMDKVFHHIGQSYYLDTPAWWADSALTQKIKERVIKLKYNLIGNRAIPFVMADSSGRKYSLYETRAEYTVLFFWSASCGHCKKTAPLLKDLYDQFKEKDVEVIAINIDKKEKEWKSYLKKHDYGWINIADGQNKTNFRTYYNIDSTPIIYLLDNQKKIVAKRIDVDTLEELLSRKLN
ncbi:MAG: thioredoxin-like domain-containing protein [Cyclobacteriaceae bacterium]